MINYELGITNWELRIGNYELRVIGLGLGVSLRSYNILPIRNC
jgi:hypothetical protein